MLDSKGLELLPKSCGDDFDYVPDSVTFKGSATLIAEEVVRFTAELSQEVTLVTTELDMDPDNKESVERKKREF